MREARFAWIEELAGYPVQGVELDFAFTPFYFKPEEIDEHIATMNDYVGSLSEMIRSKGDRLVGARVFPTEAMNLALGLDVRSWLKDGSLDYVAPLYYGYFLLDPTLPFDSLSEAAHAYGKEVYPVIQPYFLEHEKHATPAMFRAAIANYWARGADGLIIAPWFRWPFEEAQKAILSEIGDPEVMIEKNKHYFVSPRLTDAATLGYSHPLPLELKRADPNVKGEIPFFIADDCSSDRIDRVRLRLRVRNLASADPLKVELNGVSLEDEWLRRTSHRYEFQWLEYLLMRERPSKGDNVLSVTLESRPEGPEGGLTVEQLEVLVEYALPHAFDSRPELL